MHGTLERWQPDPGPVPVPLTLWWCLTFVLIAVYAYANLPKTVAQAHPERPAALIPRRDDYDR